MSINTAQDLFLEQLKDIYSAEKQAVRAYPRITKAAQSKELRDALATHLEQTKKQIERLDRVFEILEKRAGGKTCEGMKGLLEEAAESIEDIEQGPVLDAAIIAAAQRVEHYEIAAYGTVATFAEAMGEREIQQLLGETLQEEKQTDELLTGVARSVNSEALGQEDEVSDEDEDEVSDEDDEESDEDDEDLENEDEVEEDDEEDEEEKPAPKKSAARKSAAKKSGKK